LNSDNAVSASYALSSSHALVADGAFVQGGNSFGASASLGTNDNNQLVLRANTSESVYLTTDGKVGIGTNAPGRTLHVLGNGGIFERSASSPQLVIRNTNTRDWSFNIANSSGDFLLKDVTQGNSTIVLIEGSSSAGQTPFTIKNTGAVGIGTSQPQATLQVNGNISGSQILTFGTGSTVTGSFTGSFAGNVFNQNGNSFGNSASLGTNDQQTLVLKTAGNETVFISSSLSASVRSCFVGINVDAAVA